MRLIILLSISLLLPTSTLADDAKNFFGEGFVTDSDITKKKKAPPKKSTEQKTPEHPATGTVFEVPKQKKVVEDEWVVGDKKKPPIVEKAVVEPPPTNIEQDKKAQALEHIESVITKVKKDANLLKPTQKKVKIKSVRSPVVAKKSNELESIKGKVRAALKRKEAKINLEKSQEKLPILNLIVSANPPSHTAKYLRTISNIHRTYKVPVGEILIVYEKLDAENLLKKGFINKSSIESLTKLQNQGFSIKPVTKVPEHLGVTSSPTWVVRHKGEDHVFEGHDSPYTFFTAEGEFLANAIPTVKRRD